MNTVSKAAAILGIAFLTACDKDRSPDEGVVSVENAGSEPIQAWIKVTHLLPTGPPDTRYEFTLEGKTRTDVRMTDPGKLEVVISRVSDNEVLFFDSWEFDELDKLNYQVAITVTP